MPPDCSGYAIADSIRWHSVVYPTRCWTCAKLAARAAPELSENTAAAFQHAFKTTKARRKTAAGLTTCLSATPAADVHIIVVHILLCFRDPHPPKALSRSSGIGSTSRTGMRPCRPPHLERQRDTRVRAADSALVPMNGGRTHIGTRTRSRSNSASTTAVFGATPRVRFCCSVQDATRHSSHICCALLIASRSEGATVSQRSTSV